MKATHILPIFTCVFLFAANVNAQDIAIMKTGDTLSGKVMGVIQTGTGAAEWLSFKVGDNEMPTRLPLTEVLSYRSSGVWTSVAHLLGTAPPIQPVIQRDYFNKAATGFGLAGGFFAAGGLTILVSRILAEDGTLTSSAPFYVGYGLLFFGGAATVGASISLSKGAKRLKLAVAGVPVN